MDDHGPLRLSLHLGAVYDLLLGAFIAIWGTRILLALGYPAPAPFHFQLAAMPLLILPVLYWSAARAPDPDPFKLAVLWARGEGALILIAAAAFSPAGTWIYLLVGAVDLLWALVHFALWRR